MSTPDILAAVIIAALGIFTYGLYCGNLKLLREIENATVAYRDSEKDKRSLKELLETRHKDNKAFRERIEQTIFGNAKGRTDKELIAGLAAIDIAYAKLGIDRVWIANSAANAAKLGIPQSIIKEVSTKLQGDCHPYPCPDPTCESHEHPTVDPRPSNEPASIPPAEPQSPPAAQECSTEAPTHIGERLGSQGVRRRD